MRKYRNQILLGLAIILVFYAAFLLILDNQGQLSETEGIVDQILQFPLAIIPILVLCQIGVIFFRFLEWHYYLGVIDARDKISVKHSLIIFVSSFTFVVTPAKVGELLKSVLLKMRTGVTVARSAPIVIAERVVDGIAVIVILAIVFVVGGDQLELGEYAEISRQLIFFSLGIIITGLIVIQIKPLAYFFLNLLNRIPLLNRLHQPLTDFYESSREIFSLRHVVPMTVVGVGVYASSALGFVFVLIGYGMEFSPQLVFQAAFIVGVAAAVGALSFVPNGAGVTEFTTLGLLLAIVTPTNQVMTAAVAGAAAITQGFFHKWFRVLVGMLFILLFRKSLFLPGLEDELAQLDTERKHPVRPEAEVAS